LDDDDDDDAAVEFGVLAEGLLEVGVDSLG
jgi:hypothetical protein